MKWFQYICAMAVMGLIATPVSASVWTMGLSYDGVSDVVQDNSVSLALLDVGGLGGGPDGIVGVGDVIGGIVVWEDNISDGNAFGDFAISVFAVRIAAPGVAGTSVIGSNPTINFSLTGAPDVLATMLPMIGASLGGFSPTAVGVTLSRFGGTDPTTLPLLGVGGALAAIDSSFAPDFEFGLLTVSDYFEAELRDHRTIPAGGGPGVLGPDGTISITDSDGDGFADEYDDLVGAGAGALIPQGTGVVGAESGGFSIIRDFTGPGPAAYLLVPTVQLDGTSGPGTGMTQIALSPSTTLVQPTNAQAGNGYIFADQSIIEINGTPEPTSLLAWAGFASMIGLARFRRRRQLN